MNCKQIDELLPLYAGRDLDEKRARLVSTHLQACPDCARVADEYGDALDLTQHFVPPAFNDNVYASVRRQVLRQIEDEPTALLLPQMFGSWFRPRMVWATASALMIAFGFFGLYLVLNHRSEVLSVAETRPTANRTEQPPESTATPLIAKPARIGPTWKPAPNRDKGIRRIVNRPLNARDSWSRSASISPKLRDPEALNSLRAVDAAPGESPLRVEIQTKNPNIRIIWFSQSNSKPALPNSKGI